DLPVIDLDVSVEKFHLQLPPFDPLRGIPPLVGDSRIQKTVTETPTAETEKFKLNLSVKTTAADSIRIYHPFIEPFARFGLTADINDDQNISVKKSQRDFNLNYL